MLLRPTSSETLLTKNHCTRRFAFYTDEAGLHIVDGVDEDGHADGIVQLDDVITAINGQAADTMTHQQLLDMCQGFSTLLLLEISRPSRSTIRPPAPTAKRVEVQLLRNRLTEPLGFKVSGPTWNVRSP